MFWAILVIYSAAQLHSEKKYLFNYLTHCSKLFCTQLRTTAAYLTIPRNGKAASAFENCRTRKRAFQNHV